MQPFAGKLRGADSSLNALVLASKGLESGTREWTQVPCRAANLLISV
jgi:hypothetical protein